MKRLNLIFLAGLATGMLSLGRPVHADEIQLAEFYQFASKSAELFRGQLFSKSEMTQFVDELTRQTGNPQGETSALLNSLKQCPYDIQITAKTLVWLKRECHSAQFGQRMILVKLKVRLEKHFDMLSQLAKTYAG